jgi:hypothetical protein
MQGVQNRQVAFPRHAEALGRAQRDQAFDKKPASIRHHAAMSSKKPVR